MIIDAHSHVHDPVRSHIALLDEAGVDRAVLFGTRPHPERATDAASFRREMSVLHEALSGRSDGPDGFEAARRELASACAAHPDRFIGFGSVRLDLSAPQIAAEVEREVVGRGLRGIGELTPPPDGAGRIEPVLRAAADHGGLPVVVHGFAPTTAGDLATLAALARRYPTVPMVVSQLGGLNWLAAIELARETPNMYLELSTANVIFAVRLAVQEVPDRTLFGSDAPYGDPVLTRATVERVTRPGELRDRVLGGTLAELLGL
ncbi:amidohydrolase family protein [Kitasatospora sp. HPMI-4]|uniref:amidohydrolase family protein n=1 Tax=Kitasatospora sp. HPMI-4 TaxID=3448443 RepID=UPI003F1D4909